MKKIYQLSVLFLITLLILTGCQGTNNTSKSSKDTGLDNLPNITIKLSHNQPIGSPEHTGAETFKTKVEELSNGKITVEIFPSMQMGSMREQVEAVQMGTYELTLQPISVLTPFVDVLQIVDFPFLWSSTDTLYQVLDGEVGEKLLASAEPKGLKGFGFWGGGFKQFTIKGKEIHTPDDFKGVKMRVIPSPLLIAQYKAWSANAIPIEYAELYNALQQRTVDGQENPIQSIALNKFYEVQDYLIISNHGSLTYVLVGNKAWFDKLPKEYQNYILEAEKAARDSERKELAAKESHFLAEIKQSKIQVYSLTEAEKEAFKKASTSVHQEFASTPEKQEILQMIYQQTTTK